jgi:hypothetical protein
MLEKLPAALGRALKGVRPGLDKTLYRSAELLDLPEAITVSSHAFLAGEALPQRFTADGDGLSPPLEWRGVPAEAAEVIVIVEDADSPTPQPLVHAIVHRLPGRDGGIAEGALSRDPPGAAMGRNSFLKAQWLPSDPPTGHGVHRYVFQVFALREAAGLGDHPGRGAVETALKRHAIAKGVLLSTYQRP